MRVFTIIDCILIRKDIFVIKIAKISNILPIKSVYRQPIKYETAKKVA